MVKAGLVLGMFGGTQRYADLQVHSSISSYILNDNHFVQNAIPIRGDPHILVVGDPGLGKSQVILYGCIYIYFVHII